MLSFPSLSSFCILHFPIPESPGFGTERGELALEEFLPSGHWGTLGRCQKKATSSSSIPSSIHPTSIPFALGVSAPISVRVPSRRDLYGAVRQKKTRTGAKRCLRVCPMQWAAQSR